MLDDLQGSSQNEDGPTEESRNKPDPQQQEGYIAKLKGEKGELVSKLHEMERQNAELAGRFSQLSETTLQSRVRQEEEIQSNPFDDIREMFKDEELQDQLDGKPSKIAEYMLDIIAKREDAMRSEMAKNWQALGGRDEAIKQSVTELFRKDLDGIPNRLRQNEEMVRYAEELKELDEERPEYKDLDPGVKLRIIKDLKGETEQSGYPGAAGFGRPLRDDKPKLSKTDLAEVRSFAERMFEGREDAKERVDGYVKRFIKRKESGQ